MTAENLERLGAARLAEILLEVAGTRVELKRRLRMELAAEQGPEHLRPEIDRRLQLLSTSRGAVSWRQRPAFVRDLDGLRSLIAGRLAALDADAARDRIAAFLQLAAGAQRRVRDRDGGVEAVFARAARDAVQLLAGLSHREGGARLAEVVAAQPLDWGRWAAGAVGEDDAELARAALAFVRGRTGAGWAPVIRRLAQVAGDPQAFAATFSDEALRTPTIAAQVAQRFLAAHDLEAARGVLEAAVGPGLAGRGPGRRAAPDFEWETVWIDYLEAAGRAQEAQDARWASFQRTLSLERARAFTRRLLDFEDFAAEELMFKTAAAWPDAERGVEFLMDWPALREAAALIVARGEDLKPSPELAEGWARKLRRRYPQAAERLLRRAAAEAFRRRDYSLSSRLSEEADAVGP